MKHYLIILSLSFVAILIHGYQFAASDQEIFIPYIYKTNNLSLFPGDQLFNQNSANFSVFYFLQGQITKYFDIQTVFFLSYLTFQFLFFLAIFRLSKIILNSNNFAYLSLLQFLQPKFIGGTATLTFDTFFGYRTVGVIFLIFFLSLLLENDYKKSSVLALGGLLFHPLSIIPSAPYLFIGFLSSIRKRYKKNPKLVFFLVAILFVLFSFLLFINIRDLRIENWLGIIKSRDDYLFLSLWKQRAWLAFILYFSLVIIFIKDIKKEVRTKIVYFCLIALSLFAFHFLLLEVLRVPFIAQFQLVRSITPIAYISLVMSPLFLAQKSPGLKTLGIISFVTLSLNLFDIFIVAAILFSLGQLFQNHKLSKLTAGASFFLAAITIILSAVINFRSLDYSVDFPKKENDWIQLQKWVGQNTIASDLFLVPPDKTGFRIFSRRPIVGDVKDGAVVIYSQAYAAYWSKVMNDLKNYESLHEPEFINLKNTYKFNFIVTRSNQKLNLDLIYNNSSFNLYKI